MAGGEGSKESPRCRLSEGGGTLRACPSRSSVANTLAWVGLVPGEGGSGVRRDGLPRPSLPTEGRVAGCRGFGSLGPGRREAQP